MVDHTQRLGIDTEIAEELNCTDSIEKRTYKNT